MIDHEIPQFAKILWQHGEADHNSQLSSGVFGSSAKTGARCILAVAAMEADGIDVKPYLDAAHKKLSQEPPEGQK